VRYFLKELEPDTVAAGLCSTFLTLKCYINNNLSVQYLHAPGQVHNRIDFLPMNAFGEGDNPIKRETTGGCDDGFKADCGCVVDDSRALRGPGRVDGRRGGGFRGTDRIFGPGSDIEAWQCLADDGSKDPAAGS
jgi:hypothetical protein